MLDDLRRTYHWLSEADWLRYRGLLHCQQVPARTVLLREGEVADRVYYVAQGCVRAWFESRGHEVTSQFFLENQRFASLESFARRAPSFFTFETIEPCVLYSLARPDLLRIAREQEQHPAYQAQLLEFMLGRQLHYMQSFLSFIKDPPAERYQHLLREQPQLVRRVPAQYLASYLGITPVSLSRIKARLQKQDS